MTGAYLTMYSLLEKAKAIDKAASSDQTPTHIG
jgi:hypothetical protein